MAWLGELATGAVAAGFLASGVTQHIPALTGWGAGFLVASGVLGAAIWFGLPWLVVAVGFLMAAFSLLGAASVGVFVAPAAFLVLAAGLRGLGADPDGP
jgi:hypothetical protein